MFNIKQKALRRLFIPTMILRCFLLLPLFFLINTRCFSDEIIFAAKDIEVRAKLSNEYNTYNGSTPKIYQKKSVSGSDEAAKAVLELWSSKYGRSKYGMPQNNFNSGQIQSIWQITNDFITVKHDYRQQVIKYGGINNEFRKTYEAMMKECPKCTVIPPGVDPACVPVINNPDLPSQY